MTRHVHRWILALVLVATSCASQPDTEPGPATTVETSTTSLPQTTAAPDPPTSTTEVAATPEPVGVTTTTPTTAPPSTTTTEAPVSAPPVIAAIETGDLDALVDGLSAILGDLEQSLTEEEGDVFDD